MSLTQFIPFTRSRALTGALAASVLAFGLAATPAAAQYRYHGGYGGGGWHGGYHRGFGGGGALAAGVIGGLALGAIAGSAYARPRYYAPAPVYAEPVDGDCYLERRRVWNGYRYVIRRVEVCE